MKGLVIGPAGAGKTVLCNKLIGVVKRSHPTQMFSMIGDLMDTPSVYLDNPSLYRALIVSEQQVDVVLFVVDAERRGYPIPPGFAQCFSRPVYGLITKHDLSEGDDNHVQQILLQAGVIPPFWRVSSKTGEGIDAFRDWLCSQLPSEKKLL